MDTSNELTEVQYLNLTYLLTIQANLKTDPIAAAYKFHLSRELAITLDRMSVEDLRAAVSSMPFESMFEPVHNFVSLLTAAHPLAPTLSTVGAHLDVLLQPPAPGDLPS